MAKNLIPYTALKAKGITYSKPHLWRLEQQHKEALHKAQSGEGDTDSADKPSAPLFPLRVPLGPSRYAYVESEIDAYVDALVAARDAKHDHAPDAPL
jgi:prophage regulatory protein